MQVRSVREGGWAMINDQMLQMLQCYQFNHCYFKWLAIDFTLRVVLVECHITGIVICYSNGCQWTSHSVLFLWNVTLRVPLSQNLILHQSTRALLHSATCSLLLLKKILYSYQLSDLEILNVFNLSILQCISYFIVY